MDARVGNNSPLYLLERSDVGLVQLDRDLKVVAMNSFARRVLPVEDKQPFEKMVLSFHPERSQSKVKFLLDQAECPVSNPPPMTMIINIPERVLLIKVSKMSDLRGDTFGYTLVFYDITDAVIREDAGGQRPRHQAPVAQDSHRLGQPHRAGGCRHRALRPLRRALHLGPHGPGHRASATSPSATSRAGWTPSSFLRIHRSYVANLDFAEQIVRDDGRVMLKLAGGDDHGLPVARASVSRLLDRLGIAETVN